MQLSLFEAFSKPTPRQRRGGKARDFDDPSAATHVAMAAELTRASPAIPGTDEDRILVEQEISNSPVIQPVEIPTPTTPSPTNLAQVLDLLNRRPDSKTRALSNMRSAIKAVGRVVNVPLETIPTNPAALRQIFENASPATEGMTQNRWMRVRSLVLAAMADTGVPVMRSRLNTSMSPGWAELHAALPTTKLQYGLSRLLRFFTEAGIEPTDVNSATLAGFHEEVAAKSLRHGAGNSNETSRLWNAAIDAVPGWPNVRAPLIADTRKYALALDAFPESFADDVHRFLAQTTNPNPFADDYAPPVKASTTAGRRVSILEIASALVASGRPIAEVTGLKSLIEPAAAAAALQHLRERRGGGPGVHLGHQAQLLVTIAKHHAGATPDQLVKLKKYSIALTPRRAGMVERNRTRLRQFDLPANMGALLSLPARVVRQMETYEDRKRASALRVMYALAVEILTVAPLRIDNLCGLEIPRHIVAIRRGKHMTRYIVIPAAETKTLVPFEKEFSTETCRILDLYLKRYRPVLCDETSIWLFPGRKGGRRATTCFSTALSHFIFKETGLRMHSHLFRHLAGKIKLEADPGDIEAVRQVLGHKNSATTLRAYAEISTDQALKRYETTVTRLRTAELKAQSPQPSTKKRR